MNEFLKDLVSMLYPQTLGENATQYLLGKLDSLFAPPVFECLMPEAELDGLVPVRPSCETEDSAGYDLPAFLHEPVTILPGDTKVIRTGWSVRMPKGMECQVRSRSGLAASRGVSILNSPGTIEPDYYPKDIKVILHNGGDCPFTVYHGDRIAQAVFSRFIRAEGAIHKTAVRTEGLGHTGR